MIIALATAAVLVVGAVSGAAATTWYVADDGGADFAKMQDAVDAAGDGDLIFIYNGTYNENLTINNQLTLKGIGMPLVDAGECGSGIMVDAGGCIIDGFTINRSGYVVRLTTSRTQKGSAHRVHSKCILGP
ncbi:MAG: hypothetical protein U9N09_02865 [Euryarchaeota archaeon]|nr:hypothetical protein [Euryarchaeota archaeon]